MCQDIVVFLACCCGEKRSSVLQAMLSIADHNKCDFGISKLMTELCKSKPQRQKI